MGWLSDLIADAQGADSIGDWLRFVTEHQFFFAGLIILAMFARLTWAKRGSMGNRARMQEIDGGMESGWATKREVKQTGLYE